MDPRRCDFWHATAADDDDIFVDRRGGVTVPNSSL